MSQVADIRIERPVEWNWINQFAPGIVTIDFDPPASGPEIELTLSWGHRWNEALLRRRIEGLTGRRVLAFRIRRVRLGEELETPWHPAPSPLARVSAWLRRRSREIDGAVR